MVSQPTVQDRPPMMGKNWIDRYIFRWNASSKRMQSHGLDKPDNDTLKNQGIGLMYRCGGPMQDPCRLYAASQVNHMRQ